MYATYQLERKEKQELLLLSSSKKMNEDLQHILTNLPEGIVLFD